MTNIKICSYRNCTKGVGDDKRKHAEYCSRRCKDNERVYRKREKKRNESDREHIKNMLRQLSLVNPDVLELFNKINK